VTDFYTETRRFWFVKTKSICFDNHSHARCLRDTFRRSRKIGIAGIKARYPVEHRVLREMGTMPWRCNWRVIAGSFSGASVTEGTDRKKETCTREPLRYARARTPARTRTRRPTGGRVRGRDARRTWRKIVVRHPAWNSGWCQASCTLRLHLRRRRVPHARHAFFARCYSLGTEKKGDW